MRIAYTNYYDLAQYITPSSTATGYSILNTQDERLTTVWKSDSATTQTIIVDLGAAYSITTFGVLGHNLVATGTSVIGNSTVGGAGTSAMTWITTGQSSAQIITYNAGAMVKFVSPMTYQYWKFTFTGLTSPLQIGRLWVGTYLQVDPSSLLDFTVTYKNDDVVVFGKGRQKFATKGVTWREFNFSFPESSHTMVSAIKTMYETVGNHSSVIFCNFDDLTDYALVLPCYCSIDGELAFQHSERMRFKYSLKLLENK